MKQRFLRGVLLIVAAATAWGMGGVAGQYLFQNYQADAVWLVMVRQIIAGFLFLLFAWLQKQDVLRILREDLKAIAAFSFIGVLGAQLGFYHTISLCNAATATVLQYMAPVFVMLWMSLKKKTLPEGREFIGIFFAVIGVFLISTHGNIDTVVLSPAALAVGIYSAIAYAYYTVMPVELLQKYSATVVIGWGQLLSGLGLIFFRSPAAFPSCWDNQATMAFLYLLFGATIASYSLYLAGLKIVGPTKASLISCAEPLASIIAVVLLLGTVLTAEDLIGMGCIIFTVLLLSLPKK